MLSDGVDSLANHPPVSSTHSHHTDQVTAVSANVVRVDVDAIEVSHAKAHGSSGNSVTNTSATVVSNPTDEGAA